MDRWGKAMKGSVAPRHMDGIVYQHKHSHRFESQVIGNLKGLIGVIEVAAEFVIQPR